MPAITPNRSDHSPTHRLRIGSTTEADPFHKGAEVHSFSHDHRLVSVELEKGRLRDPFNHCKRHFH